MNERQIIRLIIRVIGLLGILYVVRHWAILYHKTGHIHFDSWWKLIAEICLVLIGFYMIISGATLLVNLVTHHDSDQNPKH